MLKILLLDDETPALEIMRTYLEPLSAEASICSTCSDVKSAVHNIRLHQPDILLLDIELDDGLSFEVLEHAPQLDARIIFVTAHDDYVLKALKFHAFDYLFKPIVAQELQQAVKKAISDITAEKPQPDKAALLEFIMSGGHMQKIAVPHRSGLTYYELNRITHIEADGSYAILHFADARPVTVTRKVKDFESQLAHKGFIRVHKSYLVNAHHIAELHREDSGYLIMSDHARVPISPKDKEQVIEKIRQYSTII